MILRLLGLFLLMWAGTFAVLFVMHLMEAPNMAEGLDTIVWPEISSRSFFYGAIILALYNLHQRRQRTESRTAEAEDGTPENGEEEAQTDGDE